MDILQNTTVMGPMGPLTVTFLIGFTTILLLWWYFSRNLKYWKKRGVPFVKSYPVFGSLLDMIKMPLHDLDVDRNNKLGRIYGHFEGNRAVLSVADPEILRDILVKDFHSFSRRRPMDVGDKLMQSMLSVLDGEDWKRVRTIVSPTFTTGKMKRMLGIFQECAKTLVKNFKEPAEKRKPIEVKRIYGAFTMDIIASSAFSTKIDSHNDPSNKFVTAARDVIPIKISWRMLGFFLFPRLMRFFRLSFVSPKGLKFFVDVILQIIEERKKTEQTRNDFLQLLLDTAKEMSEDEVKQESIAKDDITKNYGNVGEDVVFKNVVSKLSLSLDELVAQCIIFFVAGFETTASTLAFTTYNLALHPEIQEKLIQEVDDALRQNEGELTYVAIQEMKYLDNVISETLRLYPPAIRLERSADEDYKLGDTGIVVPKDMLITIPVYAIHRDPEFFPEPEKFDPDRFNPDERAKRSPYAYMPFGAGPRNCIATRFALLEIKVCLAYVLMNYRIKKCPQTKVPLDFHTGQGLLQTTDITVEMEVRKDAVKDL